MYNSSGGSFRCSRYVDGETERRSDSTHHYIYNQRHNTYLTVLDKHMVICVVGSDLPFLYMLKLKAHRFLQAPVLFFDAMTVSPLCQLPRHTPCRCINWCIGNTAVLGPVLRASMAPENPSASRNQFPMCWKGHLGTHREYNVEDSSWLCFIRSQHVPNTYHLSLPMVQTYLTR